MKIIHLIHGLQIGGIAALVVDLAYQSQSLGDKLKVIAVTRDPSLEVEIRYPSCFTLHELDFTCLYKPSGKGFLEASKKLRKELQAFKPEILVVHHEHLLPLVMVSSRGLKMIKIQVIHNQQLDKVYLHSTLGKIIYKKYVFVSEAARLNGIDKLALDPTKTLTIPNGIPLTKFGPSTQEVDPSFLFVGRLTAQKNLLGLLDRYERYCELTQNKPLSLSIIGKGEEELRLREEINKRHLNDKVFMIEAQGSIVDHYRSHTILLLPSFYEGTPMVILEAMACGLVVIATKVGGVSAMIDHGKEGLIYDLEDIDGFSKAMLLLSEDRSLAHQMALNAQIRSRNSDISVPALAYHNLFIELIKEANYDR